MGKGMLPLRRERSVAVRTLEGGAGPSHGADETGAVRGFGRTLLVRCAQTGTPTNPNRTNNVASTARPVVIKAPRR
jgi:hypothetical protein